MGVYPPPPGSGFLVPMPMSLPLLEAAVSEAQNNVQAPRALVLFGAMTAIAVAAQGLIDVRKPNGQCVPTSLMLLSIANSGERKTTSENVFLEPIRKFQRDQLKAHEECLRLWGVSQEIYDIKHKSIIRCIKKKVASGECSAEAEADLFKINSAAPIKPKKLKILYDDSSSEALFRGLHRDFPTAGLISSEGGGILTGRAFNDLSKQNAIWSGESITVDRVSKESYELSGARLTVSMMVQESAFNVYMERRGEMSRGSGLWARFLVCCPVSTQGSRFLRNGTISWEYRDRFADRLTELLNENVELESGSKKEKKIICFSPEACERWLQLFNSIESENRAQGHFAGAGDHASKLAENIARVAALFQYFEFGYGEISLGTLEAAVTVCGSCSGEFLRIFMPPPQEEVDALELNSWLQRYRSCHQRYVRKNYILQHGPNKLRGRERLNRALDVLYRQGQVSLVQCGKMLQVDLSPMMGSGVVY